MIERAKKFWANSRVAQGLRGPNRKKILWFAGIAAVLLVAAVSANTFFRGPASRFPQAGEYQTETAEIGVLVETIAATGNVEAGQLALLGWRTTGIVEEVNVIEGEEVQRGDVLASLQLNSLPETVIQAQADLLEAQQALEDFYASFEGLALAEAQQTVANARDTYEDALYAYNSLITTANDLTIQDAQADILFATEPLKEALEKYEDLAHKPETNENRAHAVQALYDAQSVYDAAVRTYNSYTGTGTETQIAIAQADVDVAEQAYNDAQTEYERLLAGPTDAEIAAAESAVAGAEANLKQGLIEAPFDGVVSLSLPQVGDYVVAEEEAFELQNPSTYFVQVEVNELDINQIAVGQAASVVLDAMQDTTYAASVVKVGSIGDDSSGVVNFTVVVEITEPDDQIRSGMTAVVEIETSSGAEALLVPNQAVRLEEGQQVVYVLGSGGALIPIPVKIGASSSTHSQLIEGDIQPGDAIVLNPPTEVIQAGGPFFFGGGGPPQGGGEFQVERAPANGGGN
jgi:HlyD family secretion protein